MRRVRGSEAGAQAMVEAGTVRHGKHITVTTRVQIAAHLDIRVLLDRIRVAIEERLRQEDAPAGAGVPTDRATDEAAGRTQFRWRTQRDDRVRPEHNAREGRVFEWANPPSDGEPGVPYGCRCWAEVYDDAARRKNYRITAIVGDAGKAGCTIELVPHFIDRARWEIISNEVIPPIVAEWLASAVPSQGDGVGTPARVDLGPRN